MIYNLLHCRGISRLSSFFTRGVFASDTNADLKISPYACVHIKIKNPENFAFLLLKILKLFARKVCILLKK